MSFAYLPWYTGDYRRDTADLTLVEHGIYLLLLAYCWDSRGPVPVDEARAARIVGASSDDERNAVKGILRRYFVQHDDGWYNPRLDREIAKANAISGERSEAGRRGSAERMRRLRASAQAIAVANAKQLPEQLNKQVTLTPPPPLYQASPIPEKQRQTATRQRATRLSPDWRLPDEWKAWAVEAHHLDPQQVVRISLVFRDHWLAAPGGRGTKLDWQATWRNWVRREMEHV